MTVGKLDALLTVGDVRRMLDQLPPEATDDFVVMLSDGANVQPARSLSFTHVFERELSAANSAREAIPQPSQMALVLSPVPPPRLVE